MIVLLAILPLLVTFHGTVWAAGAGPAIVAGVG